MRRKIRWSTGDIDKNNRIVNKVSTKIWDVETKVYEGTLTSEIKVDVKHIEVGL